MVRPGSAGYKVYDPQSQTARYKRPQKPKYKTKFHPSKTIRPSGGAPVKGTPMQAVVDGEYQVSLLNWERLFPSPVSDRPNFSSVDLRRHYVEFLGGVQFRVLPFTVLHVQAFDRGEYASQRKAESPTDTKQANDVQSAPPLKKTNGRAWTAENVSGHFVKIDGEQVVIRMAYGRRKKLEFDKLTEEDVSYIEKKTGRKLR